MEGLFDVHCHLVPEVDDGSRSMEMSLQMLKGEYSDGVRNIIITPHFRKQMFETSSEVIHRQFDALAAEAAGVLPDMKLYLGCEFHANMDMPETVGTDSRFTMAGSRFVLTEFSESNPQSFIKDRCLALKAKGYIPVIAHMERYPSCRESLDFIDSLINMGCRIQVNADSICGAEGFFMKRFCAKLIKYDMIDYIGSDAHNLTSRPSRIGECARFLEKKYGAELVRELMVENPAKMLQKK